MSVNVKLLNRIPFAPTVALLFGGAAAVVMFSAPVWLLEQWSEGSGLASLIPAAQAPLGDKARILITGLAAAGAGLAALLVALPIGKKLSRPVKRKKLKTAKDLPVAAALPELELGEAIEPEVATTRRRPIFAQQDLGAPFMAETQSEAAPVAPDAYAPAPVVDQAPVAQAEPAPAAFEPWQPSATPAYDTPAFETPAYEAPVAQPATYQPPAYSVPDVPAGILESQMQPSTTQYDDLPVPGFDLPVSAPPADPYATPWVDISPTMPAFDLTSAEVQPSAAVPHDELVLDALQIADIPDPVFAQEEPAAVESVAPRWLTAEAVEAPAQPVEPLPAITPVGASEPSLAQPAYNSEGPSIQELMGRVETGMRRRQLSNLVSADSVGATTAPAAEAADAALQDALGTLERLAANAR